MVGQSVDALVDDYWKPDEAARLAHVKPFKAGPLTLVEPPPQVKVPRPWVALVAD